jgi:hypothetical protein
MLNEDYVYSTENGVVLSGTLRHPENHNCDVVLIDVHGGAWTQGDRFSNAVIHEKLVAMGMAVFAIDFRMGPDFKYPISIIDINKAVRWLKSNVKNMKINPLLFGGLGTSSGGHQIILSTLMHKDANYIKLLDRQSNDDASLDFIIAGWPILDPYERYEMAISKKLNFLIQAHDDYWPTLESMREGNPMSVVKNKKFTSLPPIMILQGTADENVNHMQSDQFKAYYEIEDGEIDVIKFKNQPHAFMTKNPDSSESVLAFQKIKDFIQLRLAAR